MSGPRTGTARQGHVLIGVVFALAAALAYGISDFVGGIASRRVAALRVVLVSYPVAMVLLGLLAVGVGGTIRRRRSCGARCAGSARRSACGGSTPRWARARSGGVTTDRGAGGGGAGGSRDGAGERPGTVATVGTLLALVAIVLVSREATDEDVRPHRFTTKVAWLTVGSGLAFGLNFVLIHQAPVEARLWPLFFARLTATTVVLLVAFFSRNLVVPKGLPLRLALAAAVLDTAANVAMLLALQALMLSLAGVLMSLYPAATVLLAIVVLRERVTRWQVLGMVLALAAVAMIRSTSIVA